MAARGDALKDALQYCEPPPVNESRRPALAAAAGAIDDSRRTVEIGADEHRVNDQVAQELAKDATIYQRNGELVRTIVETAVDGGPSISATPRIEPIPGAALRDQISRHICFIKTVETKQDFIEKLCTRPDGASMP